MKLGEQETARSKIMTGRSELQETKVTGIQAKLREEEWEFLADYKNLEELDREKEIKFFPCQGDPAMTNDQEKYFRNKRLVKITWQEAARWEADTTRYSTGVDGGQAIVDTDLPLER